MSSFMVKVVGYCGGQKTCDVLVNQGGEDLCARSLRVREAVEKAPPGTYFIIVAEGRVVKKELSGEQACEFALQEANVVYGAGPDGRWASNVVGSPLLSPAAGTPYAEAPDCRVWAISIPRFVPGEETKWWLRLLRENYFEGKDLLTYAAVDDKIVLRYDESREKLGFNGAGKPYGVYWDDTDPKLIKRLGSILTRPLPFRGCFPVGNIRVGFVADGQPDSVDDGLIEISAKLALMLLAAEPQAIRTSNSLLDEAEVAIQKMRESMNSEEWQEWSDQQRKQLAAYASARAKRVQEERVTRAMQTCLYNFRGILPRGVSTKYLAEVKKLQELRRAALAIGAKVKDIPEEVIARLEGICESLKDGCLLKGNAIKVKGILLDPTTGLEVDILVHPANAKTVIKTTDEAWFHMGFQDQHWKDSARASTQLIINGLPIPLLPSQVEGLYEEGEVAEHALQWVEDEMYEVLEGIVTGRIEEGRRVAEDVADMEMGDIDMEVFDSAVLRWRSWAEKMLASGHDFRNFPSLGMRTYESFMARLGRIEAGKIRVPMPWSWMMQVIPLPKARRANATYDVPEGHIHFDFDRQVAVVSQEDWDKHRVWCWDGADLDDKFWILVRMDVVDDQMKVITGRHPNSLGGYGLFLPTPETKKALEGMKRHRTVLDEEASRPNEGVLVFRKKDQPIPKFNSSRLPPVAWREVAEGRTKYEPLEGLKAKRSFEGGYSLAHFSKLVNQMVGSPFNVGQVINIEMLETYLIVRDYLTKKGPGTRRIIRYTQEDVIDCGVQDGAEEARQAIKAYAGAKLAEISLSEAGMDYTLWRVKGDPKVEMTLKDFSITRWFEGALGFRVHPSAKKSSREFKMEDKDREGSSIATKGWNLIRTWFIHNQTPPPAGLAMLAAEEGGARERKAAYARKAMQLDKAGRYEEFGAACLELVEAHGPVAILERAWGDVQQKGALRDLLWDSRFWNPGVGDWVIAWCEANQPNIRERLAYRLTHYAYRPLWSWLNAIITDDLKDSHKEAFGAALRCYLAGNKESLLAGLATWRSKGWVTPVTHERLLESLDMPHRRPILAEFCGYEEEGEGDKEGGSDTPPSTPSTPPAPLPEAPIQEKKKEDEMDEVMKENLEFHLDNFRQALREELHRILFEEAEFAEDYDFCQEFWQGVNNTKQDLDSIWKDALRGVRKDGVEPEYLAALDQVIKEVEDEMCSVQKKATDPKKEAIRLANERF